MLPGGSSRWSLLGRFCQRRPRLTELDAMALLKKDYRNSTKGGMPKHWLDSHPHTHTHIAVDDAIAQGALFCNMLAENLSGP